MSIIAQIISDFFWDHEGFIEHYIILRWRHSHADHNEEPGEEALY